MNFDFEEFLRRQSIRPIPSEWRAEILRASRAKPTSSPWWREWMWPCPQAWAGLAAAWGIILLLTFTAPEETSTPGHADPSSRRDFAFLRQETEIIARLSDFEENRPAPAPQPPALKPRSSRRVHQCIG